MKKCERCETGKKEVEIARFRGINQRLGNLEIKIKRENLHVNGLATVFIVLIIILFGLEILIHNPCGGV